VSNRSLEGTVGEVCRRGLVVVDGELEVLIRQSLFRALRTPPSDLGAELHVVASLFEEHGYVSASPNTWDVVTATVIGLDRPLPVIWPLQPDATATEIGGSGVVVMEGAVQRDGLHARTVLCPLSDRIVSLTVSSVDEQLTGEMVAGSPWVRVQVWGCPSADLGSWPEVRRRACLALARELVEVAYRIIDGTASGLAQASVEMAVRKAITGTTLLNDPVVAEMLLRATEQEFGLESATLD
jgi:hypothetical protein